MRTPHFLIVENNRKDQELLEQTLSKHFPEASFTSVWSGEDALKEVHCTPFDVICLAYSLPRTNGLEILKTMQTKGIVVPTIMVAEKSDPQIAIEALKRGAYDYIVKSPNQSHLHLLPSVVQQALEKWKLLQEQEQEQLRRTMELAKQETEFLIDFFIHEIASIHNAALGFLDVLEDRSDQNGMLPLYLESIRRNLQRGQAFIEQIKVLSSARAVSSDRFVPLNLVGSIRRSIEVSTQMFPQYALEFHTSFASERCPIHATSLLDFIFINLLSNAVKYDSHPSKRIEIDVVDMRDKDCWQVSITDRGVGIPDELKLMLFQRLSRVSQDRKRQGCGLGLFIVRTLVEKFGGRIWVENRVPTNSSHGSRFVSVFPKAPTRDHPKKRHGTSPHTRPAAGTTENT